MGDDAAGIQAIRMVRDKVPPRSDLEFKEVNVGGLRLVEEMLGYDTVFIVDTLAASDSEVGRIREFSPSDFDETQHTGAPHVTNFATALELYKKLEPDMVPRLIRIFTIDVEQDLTFREGMSPRVQEAVLKLTEMLVRQIM
jgi:hydrogenase maturation protease